MDGGLPPRIEPRKIYVWVGNWDIRKIPKISQQYLNANPLTLSFGLDTATLVLRRSLNNIYVYRYMILYVYIIYRERVYIYIYIYIFICLYIAIALEIASGYCLWPIAPCVRQVESHRRQLSCRLYHRIQRQICLNWWQVSHNRMQRQICLNWWQVSRRLPRTKGLEGPEPPKANRTSITHISICTHI